MTSLTTVINKLIDKAYFWKYLKADFTNKGKPGELINQLSEEEREILKSVTAKDFDVRKENII